MKDIRTYLERMDGRIEECSIPNASPQGDYDCLPLLRGDPLQAKAFPARLKQQLQPGKPVHLLKTLIDDNDNDDDDDDQELRVRVTLSMLNPTVFGLHFGRMTCKVRHVEDNGSRAEFATAIIPDFHIKDTQRSASARQNLTVEATPVDPFGVLKIFEQWKAGENITLAVVGSEIGLDGYGEKEMDGMCIIMWLTVVHRETM